jgi:hypothetical protein
MSSFFGRVRIKVKNQASAASPPPPADALSAFLPEDSDPQPADFVGSAEPPSPALTVTLPAADPAAAAKTRKILIGSLSAAAVVAAGVVLFQMRSPSMQALASPNGRLVVETKPIGAEVLIDGQRRGHTPLALEVPPGSHTLSVVRLGQTRTLPVQIAAGGEVTHYLEFAEEAAPIATGGHLSIVTDPPGARVSIDGEQVGRSPLTVNDLKIARHRVVVTGDHGSAERQVSIAAGTTTSVVFALPSSPPATAGYLTLVASFPVQVSADGEILGSNASSRIMVKAGRYDLMLKNDELGFQERRRVDIQAGQTTTVRLDAKATISVNARPWADVTIDGVSIGQTPIANHSIALGSHDIVFRHPEMGEKRQTVVVSSKSPNRISMDMTK